jgi:hypothetical protein
MFRMRPPAWVRLLTPLIAAFALSKAGWIHAIVFQRDQPISPFQKTLTKYASLALLGMLYLGLWQYEIDTILHVRGAWRILLVVWLIFIGWMAVRALRLRPALSSETQDAKPASAPENIVKL